MAYEKSPLSDNKNCSKAAPMLLQSSRKAFRLFLYFPTRRDACKYSPAILRRRAGRMPAFLIQTANAPPPPGLHENRRPADKSPPRFVSAPRA